MISKANEQSFISPLQASFYLLSPLLLPRSGSLGTCVTSVSEAAGQKEAGSWWQNFSFQQFGLFLLVLPNQPRPLQASSHNTSWSPGPAALYFCSLTETGGEYQRLLLMRLESMSNFFCANAANVLCCPSFGACWQNRCIDKSHWSIF